LKPIHGGERVHAIVDTPEGPDAIHHAAEHFNADPDYVIGTGVYIGTNLETGSDAEQRADALREYEKVIDQVAGALEGSDIRGVWADTSNHWRATAIDEKAAASGLTAPAAPLRGVLRCDWR